MTSRSIGIVVVGTVGVVTFAAVGLAMTQLPVIGANALLHPVLLIHGAADLDTPPAHSERVLAALGGPKRLRLVPGAGHNQSLQGETWTQIERWIDSVVE